MVLTKKQKELVNENVITELKNRFEFGDKQASLICGLIINDVIKDIEKSADWRKYLDDEVNLVDIEVAVSGVLSK